MTVISGADLKIALCECDNNRFEDIVHTMGISDNCSSCSYFNLSKENEKKWYDCYSAPRCIAATLHPDVVSFLNLRLGWIDAEEHLSNLGITKE